MRQAEQRAGLIDDERVHPATREILEQRVPDPAPSAPQSLTAEAYVVLQTVARQFVPRAYGANPVDVAARLERKHRGSSGNGWRYADMPPDREALERGLLLLNGEAITSYKAPFALLTSEQQCELLRRVQQGQLVWPGLNGQRWFEETLADLLQLWISHPNAYAELGFSGVADRDGWTAEQLLQVEAWEPGSEA